MSDRQAAVPGRDGGQPLAGQVAIVTGGGRGLGRGVALRLAAAGACVAVAARSVEQIADTVARIEGSGGRASDFPADISDPGAVRDLVAAVEADLGPVDVLVNNAAVIWPLGPVWEVDPQEWWRLLEINLYGTFLCSNAVLSGMTQRGRGRIVNVASGAGIVSPPFGSAYVTSKAAVIRLTEELAMETEQHGVSVFAIDPGWMSTEMTRYLAESDSGRQWTPWAPAIFGTEAHVPLERAAELVLTLATGRADQLTGRFLTVWDDLDDLILHAEDIRARDLHRVRLRI